MFVIRVYEPQSMGYAMYSTDEYKVVKGPDSTCIQMPGVDAPRQIFVDCDAYVMNAQGKTIDVIKGAHQRRA